MGPEKWQPTLLEFELESRNFLLHGHDVRGADLIVCWKHNWENCPLEVIELRKEIAEMEGEEWGVRRRPKIERLRGLDSNLKISNQENKYGRLFSDASRGFGQYSQHQH